MSISNQFTPFRRRLLRYFKAYGGWRAIFGSPLFLAALIITILSYSNWLKASWVSLSQELIPSLLGFSLGTYAILFSLITNRLKRSLKAKKNENGTSYLEEINATFFHFIFVQVLALTWAFLFNGTALFDLFRVISTHYPFMMIAFHVLFIVGSFTGFLLLVYSFLLILGAALAVYRLAVITDPADD